MPSTGETHTTTEELTGAAATARWHEVRWLYLGGRAVVCVVLVLDLLLASRPAADQAYVAAGLLAAYFAVLVARHNLIRIKYMPKIGDVAATFAAEEPPLSRRWAVSLLALTAIVLLIVGGTSTSFANTLSPVVEVGYTTVSAALMLATLMFVVAMFVFAVRLILAGFSARLKLRWGENESDRALILSGVALLALVGFSGFLIVGLPTTRDFFLDPFTEIAEWWG